jgi:predicted nucleic acid-binding protein
VEEARVTTAVKLLRDASVLIDVLRRRNRRNEILAELVRAGHTLSTTSLDIAEVYARIRPGEDSRAEAELTGAAGRKGRALTLADTMVAAISIERKCVLVTDNRKDFPMPESKVVSTAISDTISVSRPRMSPHSVSKI